LFSSHVTTNILRNGSKNVVNYIMGFHVLIAMGAMKKVNIHKVNGVWKQMEGGLQLKDVVVQVKRCG